MALNEQKLTELSTLRSKMLTFPAGFYEARQRVLDAEQRVKSIKAEIEDAEVEERLMISLKETADGKKAYPNDQARKDALAKALADSPTHRDRIKRLNDAETELTNTKIAMQRIEDEHRAWRAVVDITLAEVQLLVAAR